MQTVLAVDDSETMRQMVKMTLQAGNYQVVLAHDGEDGLSKFLSTSDVDLIITDISMPWMSGLQVAMSARSAALYVGRTVTTGTPAPTRSMRKSRPFTPPASAMSQSRERRLAIAMVAATSDVEHAVLTLIARLI